MKEDVIYFIDDEEKTTYVMPEKAIISLNLLADENRKLQDRIKTLESGLKHIHAESEAFVLTKYGYKHAPVHKMYGMLAKKYLRME